MISIPILEKMTIDTLARMTQDEFSRMDEKLEARFDKVDQHLDKVDSTLKTVLDVVLDIPSKRSFNRLENKMEQMDVRLTAVERKVK